MRLPRGRQPQPPFRLGRQLRQPQPPFRLGRQLRQLRPPLRLGRQPLLFILNVLVKELQMIAEL